MANVHKVVAVVYVGRPWHTDDEKKPVFRNFQEVPQDCDDEVRMNSEFLEMLLNDG